MIPSPATAGNLVDMADRRSGADQSSTYRSLRLLDFEDLENDDGSWREWSSSDDAPVER